MGHSHFDFGKFASLLVQHAVDESPSGFCYDLDFDEVSEYTGMSRSWIEKNIDKIDEALKKHNGIELIGYEDGDMHESDDCFSFSFPSRDDEFNGNDLLICDNGKWRVKTYDERLEDEITVKYHEVEANLANSGFTLNEYGLVEYQNFNGSQYAVYSDGVNDVLMKYHFKKIPGTKDAWLADDVYEYQECINFDLENEIREYSESLFPGEVSIQEIKSYHPEEYGLEKDDKVHLLISYTGNVREDDFFNAMHGFSSSSCLNRQIDFNPVCDVSCRDYLAGLDRDYINDLNRFRDKLLKAAAQRRARNADDSNCYGI